MKFQGDGQTSSQSPVGICIPGIVVHEDGTIDRSRFESSTPFVQASENENELVQGVATKDVVIDHKLGLWIRIFLPKASNISIGKQQQESNKLPIVLYFHPSGFVILSAGSKPCHELCCKMASRAQVMVVSVEYRKAPEHKLPAAFQDAATALRWLQAQASAAAAAADSNVNEEPWLLHYADFSSCFLMGHSAGATIVHDLAYRASKGGEGLSLSAPVNVRGIISCIACFGGSQCKGSEMKFAERDPFLTMKCLSSFWTLALPEGADLDHPYANFQSSDAPKWEGLRIPPVMTVVGEHDLMLDRQLEFAQMLKDSRINVTLVECKGRSHSEILFPELSGEEKDTENAYLHLKEFMAMCSNRFTG